MMATMIVPNWPIIWIFINCSRPMSLPSLKVKGGPLHTQSITHRLEYGVTLICQFSIQIVILEGGFSLQELTINRHLLLKVLILRLRYLRFLSRFWWLSSNEHFKQNGRDDVPSRQAYRLLHVDA